MIVGGIDPGLTGAIASWDGSNLHIEDIPIVKAQGKKGGEINMPGLLDLIDFTFCDMDHCYIEQVNAMPKQGVSSTFKFGYTAGALKMGILSARIPVTMVSSVKWKSELGLNSDGEKSRSRALELFPSYSQYFTRKMDHNRAEAALLAYYGWKTLKGELVRSTRT